MKLLFSYLRPYRPMVALAIMLAVINQVFSMLDPQIFRIIVDKYASHIDTIPKADFIKGVGLMILAVLLDGDGRPVCTEMWPGNTADVGSLAPVVDRLRKRFSIQRICVVADRGMISAETIAELEARGLFYILGVRERSDKLVRELVLDDPAPFIPLTIAKRDKDIDYEAKAVALAGRRYIVCRNREEMKKDAAARATILAALERQLKKGDKSLVGNKGYRRFLATPDDDHFVIDRAKAEEDAKFDGIFVLRTNTDLSPLDAMLCYKRLWMVDIDQAWRLSKLCGGGGGAFGGPRRNAAPGRRRGADRLQRRDRLGVGAHQDGAFRTAANVAAR